MNKLINTIKNPKVTIAALGAVTVGGISTPTALLIVEKNKFNKTLDHQVNAKVKETYEGLQQEKNNLEEKQKTSDEKIRSLEEENTNLKNQKSELDSSKQKISELETTKKENEQTIKVLTEENKRFKGKEDQLNQLEQTIQKAKIVELQGELKGSLHSWATDAINKKWSGYKPYFCLYHFGYECWYYGRLETIDQIKEMTQ